jgi:hypothetical protein
LDMVTGRFLNLQQRAQPQSCGGWASFGSSHALPELY